MSQQHRTPLHHDPASCRCCAATSLAVPLMPSDEWTREFRPLMRLVESDGVMPDCFDPVRIEEGSSAYAQALAARQLWAVAVAEKGHFIVPGEGDGCRSVVAHYRTEVSWDAQTAPVAWWVFQAVPSLDAIVKERLGN